MFAFDVEKIPFFGVEIIEQPIECGCLCMEKTGRIYCSQNGLIFEYNPHQDMTMLLCGQGEERISCLQCTPSNCLLVMRDVSKHKNLLEVYQLPE